MFNSDWPFADLPCKSGTFTLLFAGGFPRWINLGVPDGYFSGHIPAQVDFSIHFQLLSKCTLNYWAKIKFSFSFLVHPCVATISNELCKFNLRKVFKKPETLVSWYFN